MSNKNPRLFFCIKTKDDIPPSPRPLLKHFSLTFLQMGTFTFLLENFVFLSSLLLLLYATTSYPAKCSKESYTWLNLLYPYPFQHGFLLLLLLSLSLFLFSDALLVSLFVCSISLCLFVLLVCFSFFLRFFLFPCCFFFSLSLSFFLIIIIVSLLVSLPFFLS